MPCSRIGRALQAGARGRVFPFPAVIRARLGLTRGPTPRSPAPFQRPALGRPGRGPANQQIFFLRLRWAVSLGVGPPPGWGAVFGPPIATRPIGSGRWTPSHLTTRGGHRIFIRHREMVAVLMVSLAALLPATVDQAAGESVKGAAHRGRLNVPELAGYLDTGLRQPTNVLSISHGPGEVDGHQLNPARRHRVLPHRPRLCPSASGRGRRNANLTQYSTPFPSATERLQLPQLRSGGLPPGGSTYPGRGGAVRHDPVRREHPDRRAVPPRPPRNLRRAPSRRFSLTHLSTAPGGPQQRGHPGGEGRLGWHSSGPTGNLMHLTEPQPGRPAAGPWTRPNLASGRD